MQIDRVTLRHLKMRLKAPFTTSFGSFLDREFLLAEVVDEDGRSGWGESVAFQAPWYNEETVKTNWHILEDFLIPALFEEPVRHPDDLTRRFGRIRRNNMAKSTLEGALWDLYAKTQGVSLARALGGSREKIDVGISIGIQDTVDDLLHTVSRHVAEGYRRIKIKIKPGWDIEAVRALRKEFPDLPLMVDANSAYTLNDIDHLKQLDDFDLMMIEQPLASDDIIDHARLQSQLNTPICLDESIHSVEDARKAIELGACRIINIKIGRVGGLSEAKRIHDLCRQKGIPVWCGGMLESGVGRAHNIAITALEGFTLPGDTAASSRYWERDLIDPQVEVVDGQIVVPQEPGIGYPVDRSLVDAYTLESRTYHKSPHRPAPTDSSKFYHGGRSFERG